MPDDIALVTGAAGFIGRSVCRTLRRSGYRVWGIGRGELTSEQASDIGLARFEQDSITPESLARMAIAPRLIVHCAGGASVRGSIEAPHADYSASVQSTADLLEYVRCFSPRSRLSVCSSAAVYGDTTRSPISIAERPAPISPYGAHKLMAETQCMAYARQFELAISIVRLFSVFGMGNRKQLLWDGCCKLTRGNATFGGTGAETRDWVEVTESAALLVQAAEAATPECRIYNGGRGIPTTTRAVLECLARALGTKADISFSGVRLPGDPTHLVADITETLSLGWQPSRSIEPQLEAYASWFRGFA